MSWITVDTKLPDHPKMATLPNDTARWGWIVTLLEAKEQRKPGTFASERHYCHVLSRHGKFLTDYIKAGLMDQDEDGTLHVHDWQRHQWSVSKAKQRGQDEDMDETSEGQKEDASRAVPVPVYVGVRNDVEKTESRAQEIDAFSAFHRRTGQVPGTKLGRWLNELTEKHGEKAVVALIIDTPMDGKTPPDYLKEVTDRLRLQEFSNQRAEKRDEERRNAEKRKPAEIRPAPADISDEEAERLAAEYAAKARRSA